MGIRSPDKIASHLTHVGQIWDNISDGIPGFLESINEALSKMLDGLA